MKKYKLSVVFLLLMLSMFYSHAGMIRFNGNIYQSPCSQTFTDGSVIFRCQQGQLKTRQKTAISVRDGALPMDLGTRKLTWINPQHSLGVMVISYR